MVNPCRSFKHEGMPVRFGVHATCFVLLFFLLFFFSIPSVFADSDPVDKIQEAEIEPRRISSLFFTYWQYEAILDSKKSRGFVRPPTQQEIDAIARGEALDYVDPGSRDIVLGGIVFRRQGDWTIWLNGQRITPDSLPKEVIDLRVFKDYIEVKWLDGYTKQIFPLRLRSHERFNMDSRIFLPG